MLRKLFVVAMVSFMSSSIFAGSHGNIFKAQGTCANKHSAMRMMGELPLHIGGEMNCSDQIQIKGDRTDMGSTCTYSGHTELGQPPMLNWVVTCHSYDAKGDSIFWRAVGIIQLQLVLDLEKPPSSPIPINTKAFQEVAR